VLAPEDVDRMTRGDIDDPDSGTRYGFGLWRLERDGHVLIGHSGSLAGYRSMIVFDRERGLGAVVLTNGEAEWRSRVDLLAFALDVASGQEPSLPDVETRTTIADAGRYVGRYVGGDGEALEVRRDGDGLAATVDGATAPLERALGDGFVLPLDGWDRHVASFEPAHGGAERVVAGSRLLHREGTFALPPPPADRGWEALVGRYRCYGIEPMNVEVLVRAGTLRLVTPTFGEDDELVPLGEGWFRVGRDAWLPGRARFETAVGERATRVILDGASFARVP
jgi:hypothetical protein